MWSRLCQFPSRVTVWKCEQVTMGFFSGLNCVYQRMRPLITLLYNGLHETLKSHRVKTVWSFNNLWTCILILIIYVPSRTVTSNILVETQADFFFFYMKALAGTHFISSQKQATEKSLCLSVCWGLWSLCPLLDSAERWNEREGEMLGYGLRVFRPFPGVEWTV